MRTMMIVSGVDGFDQGDGWICFISFLEDCEAANIVGAVELFVLKLRSRLKDSSVAEGKNP
jgi:hypothetical protein